ncbi:MAG: PAS domain-containing protein, partial [Deltaproteobacteria bacterium]|nr:PAS domain-containing protein [Deltaproteobacteria bacterium]
MADNPTDPLVALERENRALRERVSELERTLRRFEDGSSRPLGQGLSEREALLVEAERIAHVGSWVWDVRTDQVIWSDELFRILGYDPSTDEATTTGFFARVHPADVDRVREASQRGIATGVSRQVDFRVLRPDGSVRFVTMDGALLFDAGGTLVRAVGTVLDVTGAVHTSDELRQAANRLAEAQRIGRMGSWEWNLATGEVRWSEELHRILGHPVGQPPLTLEAFEQLVHPEDRERIHEAAIRSTTEAGATSMDMRLVLPDGSLKHVHVQTVVEPAHDGRPIHRG